MHHTKILEDLQQLKLLLNVHYQRTIIENGNEVKKKIKLQREELWKAALAQQSLINECE